MNGIRGVTALELLIVVSISALLGLLAWPGFQASLARAKLQAERNALHHALHQARRESIKRNEFVALCKSADGSRCDPALNWSDGWMVFVDLDRKRPLQRADDEPRVAVHNKAPGVQILANRKAFVARTLRYRTTNGSFIFCDERKQASALALIVSHTGRPRMRPGAHLNGRLSCAD